MTYGDIQGYHTPPRSYSQMFDIIDVEECECCHFTAELHYWKFTEQRLCKECIAVDFKAIEDNGDDDETNRAKEVMRSIK